MTEPTSPTSAPPPEMLNELREWFWRCSLNLQNAAIKSTPQIAHPCDADAFADDAIRKVDELWNAALAEQPPEPVEPDGCQMAPQQQVAEAMQDAAKRWPDRRAGILARSVLPQPGDVERLTALRAMLSKLHPTRERISLQRETAEAVVRLLDAAQAAPARTLTALQPGDAESLLPMHVQRIIEEIDDDDLAVRLEEAIKLGLDTAQSALAEQTQLADDCQQRVADLHASYWPKSIQEHVAELEVALVESRAEVARLTTPLPCGHFDANIGDTGLCEACQDMNASRLRTPTATGRLEAVASAALQFRDDATGGNESLNRLWDALDALDADTPTGAATEQQAQALIDDWRDRVGWNDALEGVVAALAAARAQGVREGIALGEAVVEAARILAAVLPISNGWSYAPEIDRLRRALAARDAALTGGEASRT